MGRMPLEVPADIASDTRPYPAGALRAQVLECMGALGVSLQAITYYGHFSGLGRVLLFGPCDLILASREGFKGEGFVLLEGLSTFPVPPDRRSASNVS